ncbi:MAG: Aminodeoxychorismate lyase [Parcubacteria group bacterium GW2011_GWA2_43_11]|nr:MAG: Aminodeoxychorismate lyase [Parcubacteria group bacterium GW2011_GWA2_43_11]
MFFEWWRARAVRRVSCPRGPSNRAPFMGLLLGVLIGTSAWGWFGVYQPPSFFPIKTIVTIPEGATLSGVASILQKEQVVQSALAFRVFVTLFNSKEQIRAGDYYFNERLTLHEVAERFTHGEFGLESVRVTIPEGATTYQMAHIFEERFERFDTGEFLMLAEEKEGYLFPDTYFFLPNVSTSQILTTMERTFYERLQTLEEKIAAFGRPVHEVVTMASLLEKEAREYDERQIIAGVLWSRLQIEMPLQVDAVFGFIEKTDTFSPKYSHLESESLYNTYKNTGLPPGPIGSPSLEAIEAAVTPVETDALFYLHGRDGVLHIAHTYAEHLVNRRSYLD